MLDVLCVEQGRKIGFLMQLLAAITSRFSSSSLHNKKVESSKQTRPKSCHPLLRFICPLTMWRDFHFQKTFLEKEFCDASVAPGVLNEAVRLHVVGNAWLSILEELWALLELQRYCIGHEDFDEVREQGSHVSMAKSELQWWLLMVISCDLTTIFYLPCRCCWGRFGHTLIAPPFQWTAGEFSACWGGDTSPKSLHGSPLAAPLAFLLYPECQNRRTAQKQPIQQ